MPEPPGVMYTIWAEEIAEINVKEIIRMKLDSFFIDSNLVGGGNVRMCGCASVRVLNFDKHLLTQ